MESSRINYLLAKGFGNQRVCSIAQTMSFLVRRIAALPRGTHGLKVIAISGPAASGKTTLAGLLSKSLERCLVVEMDRWRGALTRPDITREEFIEILGIDQFRVDIAALIEQGRLERPPRLVVYKSYNQKREYEENPLLLGDCTTILIVGIAVCYKKLAGLSQLKIDVGACEQIRTQHKLQRTLALPANARLSSEFLEEAELHVELVKHDLVYSYQIFERIKTW